MNSATPTFWSRLVASLSLGIGAATYGGLIPGKAAAYSALALAMLQAFQHPVQGTDLVAVAASQPVQDAVVKDPNPITAPSVIKP